MYTWNTWRFAVTTTSAPQGSLRGSRRDRGIRACTHWRSTGDRDLGISKSSYEEKVSQKRAS